MTFTVVISKKTLMGNKRFNFGSYTNGASDEGGELDTGLKRVEAFWVVVKGAACTTKVPVINETLPLAGGTVTLITYPGEDGYWYALGK